MLLRSDPGAQMLPGNSGRRHGQDDPQSPEDQLGLESPIHPLGIKPSGNKLLSAGTVDAREAIGAFQALPDGTAF